MSGWARVGVGGGEGRGAEHALGTGRAGTARARAWLAPHPCCRRLPSAYLDAAAPELAALAVSKLDSALRELEVTGAADYVAHHAPPPRPRGRRQSEAPEAPAAVRAEGEGASEAPGASGREASAEPGAEASASAAAAESAQAQRQLTDAVRDLDRWGGWRALGACRRRTWLDLQAAGAGSRSCTHIGGSTR